MSRRAGRRATRGAQRSGAAVALDLPPLIFEALRGSSGAQLCLGSVVGPSCARAQNGGVPEQLVDVEGDPIRVGDLVVIEVAFVVRAIDGGLVQLGHRADPRYPGELDAIAIVCEPDELLVVEALGS